MKTSLLIDDRVFEEAKRESARTGQTISEIISRWAQLGREVWKQDQKNKSKRGFKPRDLGPLNVDLSSRKQWMEDLDDDRD